MNRTAKASARMRALTKAMAKEVGTLRATLRAIDASPGETHKGDRKSKYTFKGTYESTLRLLDDEVRHLSATDLVIQLKMDDRDIPAVAPAVPCGVHAAAGRRPR